MWIKKHFPTTWAATSVLDDFVQLFIGMGGPAGMMLVEDVHTRLNSTLWISLPDEDLLEVFPGFVAAEKPPSDVVLLAGNKSGFAVAFKK